jgi:hypothetical protein
VKRLRALFLLIALVGFVLAAPATPAEPEDIAAIQALLDKRAKAVLQRDKEAFISTIDGADAKYKRAQSLWFDRFKSVPLAGYLLEVDADETPDLTRSRDRAKYDAPIRIALVQERFRIEGFDEIYSLHNQFLTFIKRDSGWLIATDADLEDLGLNSSRQPWDFAEIQIKTSPHFMLVFHPQNADLADGLLASAEQALPGVDRVWKSQWSKKVAVYVPASTNELEKLLDATIDVDNFVAFAIASVDRKEGFANASPRVILNPSNFLRFTQAGQQTILSHEFLHVATRGASGPFVNLMVEEGYAQLAEGSGGAALAQVGRRARTQKVGLPEDLDFVSGGGPSIGFAYLRAFSAFEFLQSRFGAEKVTQFYKDLGSRRTEPGTAFYHLDQSLQKTLGLTRAQFEEQWLKFAAGSR